MIADEAGRGKKEKLIWMSEMIRERERELVEGRRKRRARESIGGSRKGRIPGGCVAEEKGREWLKMGEFFVPISLIQNDDLVPPRRKGDLLLRKRLDLVPNDVDSSAFRPSEPNQPHTLLPT
jgi:hypothetical protein